MKKKNTRIKNEIIKILELINSRDFPLEDVTIDWYADEIIEIFEECQKVLVDVYSLVPEKCYELYQLACQGKIEIRLPAGTEDVWKRKIEYVQKGEEFLPEYYDFAKQIGIGIDAFRDKSKGTENKIEDFPQAIQKEFGFRIQFGDKEGDYIKKGNKWIKIRDWKDEKEN